MEKRIPLEYGKFYHIYNRGINGDRIFFGKENYLHFLKLYEIYINSIADTFAWCLMSNHFHFLIRIKDEEQIGFLNPENGKTKDYDNKWKTFFPDKDYTKYNISDLKKPIPNKQFSHLFDAYAKAYNKRFNRFGSLFEKNFERKNIDNERYMRNLILYIHNNPVKHGITSSTIEYPCTSYLSILSKKVSNLKREQVLSWFENSENFEYSHKTIDNYDDIIEYIID
jgi:REP element-mobilizing transposase RayT